MKEYFDQLSRNILNCAIEVHKNLGPGLLESVYVKCLECEFVNSNIDYNREFPVKINYKGLDIDSDFRIDFLVEKRIILELKSVKKILDIHRAQLLTYMKLSGIKHGFLINFNVKLLKNGISSFVL